MIHTLMNRRHLPALILAATLLTRLFMLDAPIVGHHAWKQSDLSNIARIFHEEGYRFLYPQNGTKGAEPSYLESEFPLYTYGLALCYGVFGPRDMVGRLYSIGLFLIALIYFFHLVKELTDRETALWSLFFLAMMPRLAFFSRVVITENMLLLTICAGLYYFSKWLQTGKAAHWAAGCLFISIACLLKIPTLYIGLPLLYLSWKTFGSRTFVHPRLLIFAAIVFVCLAGWYWHAHQLYRQTGLTFGIWGGGSTKWGNWGLVFSLAYWKRVLIDLIAVRHLSVIGFFIFAAGLFLKRRARLEPMFDYWLAALMVYLMMVGVGNYVHDYYQLPIMLPVAVYMGKLYARYFKAGFYKKAVGWVLLVCLAGFAVLSSADYIGLAETAQSPESRDQLKVAEAIRRNEPEHGLVISAIGGNTIFLHLTRRKGWLVYPKTLDEKTLSTLRHAGAGFLIGPSQYLADWQKKLTGLRILYKNSRYFAAGI